MATIDDAHQWVDEHREALQQSLHAHEEIPSFMKHLRLIQDVWSAGCWLGMRLQDAGATPAQCQAIAFVHGQRSVSGDPYVWACHYLNEFLRTGAVVDQPGTELAHRIWRGARL